MAFTEFYCQSGGSNLNAGSTNSNAPSRTYASGSWNSTTRTFTPAVGNPLADGVSVGDFVSIFPDAATVTPYVARVVTVTATTIALSGASLSGTAPATGTSNTTCRVGGAWKGPNGAEGFPFGFAVAAMTNVSGHQTRVNFKNTASYVVSATINHTLGGPIVFEGYSTIPGDGGLFVLDGGNPAGTSFIILNLSGGVTELASCIVQNNGTGGNAHGLSIGSPRALFRRVVCNTIRGAGFSSGGAVCTLVECEAYACNASNTLGYGGFQFGAGVTFIRCLAHDNVGSNNAGFAFINNSIQFTLIDCISESNGYGVYVVGTTAIVVVGGSFHNNLSHGIRNGGSSCSYTENLIATSNGGYGIDGAATVLVRSVNNAYWNNTSGEILNTQTAPAEASITLTADPYMNAAVGDFRISQAALKGKGRGAFTQSQAGYAGTVGYPDVGAAQARGSGADIFSSGVFK